LLLAHSVWLKSYSLGIVSRTTLQRRRINGARGIGKSAELPDRGFGAGNAEIAQCLPIQPSGVGGRQRLGQDGGRQADQCQQRCEKHDHEV
jgi:hypothetical protein